MTPLTKRRWSTRRQGKRRATHALKALKVVYCPNCKAPVAPHTVCAKCGFYKGTPVIQIKTKVAKQSKTV